MAEEDWKQSPTIQPDPFFWGKVSIELTYTIL